MLLEEAFLKELATYFTDQSPVEHPYHALGISVSGRSVSERSRYPRIVPKLKITLGNIFPLLSQGPFDSLVDSMNGR